MQRFSAFTLAVLVAVSSAVAKDKKKDPEEIGNRDVGKGVNFYSIEKEIALGKQLAQEVERQAKIVDDPVIAEYVNRVGQNLVRNSDAKVPFTIKVIDAEEINAFALPGGPMYVNRGMIEATLPRAPDMWATTRAPAPAPLLEQLATLRRRPERLPVLHGLVRRQSGPSGADGP